MYPKVYRKKPVEIEAVQFTDDNKDIVFDWIKGSKYPEYLNGEPILRIQNRNSEYTFTIHVNDYVVKEDGKYYVVKPEVFNQIYELVKQPVGNAYHVDKKYLEKRKEEYEEMCKKRLKEEAERVKGANDE